MTNDTELGTLLSTRATDVVDHLDLPADLLSTVHSAHRRHRRNRIAGAVLGTAVVLAGAGVGATALSNRAARQPGLHEAARPVTYHNARFGFRDLIPGGFTPDLPSEDGDGLRWHSGDLKAILLVTAGNNVNRLTPAADLAGNEQRYQGPHAVITGHSEDGPVIMVTGIVGGEVFYQRDVVLSRVIYTIEWNYPVADKATYDPMVTSTVDTFRPGPNRTG